MTPTVSVMNFGGQQTQTIELEIHPMSQVGSGEAFLYISDVDQHVMECIAIEIMYMH